MYHYHALTHCQTLGPRAFILGAHAGEILVWIGVLLLGSYAIQVRPSTWWIIFSPLLVVVLLLFVSGMPILERTANSKYGHRADYQAYRASTSILVLLPPALYRPLPPAIKAVFLFEWPLYARTDTESQPINRPASESSPATSSV